jgi:LmbE family N-acetylglucosaminyl deacetylase
MKLKNILAVAAHPDDLEMMGGGSMLRFQKENINIHVLVLTYGAWNSQNGTVIRSKDESSSEMHEVNAFMHYTTCDVLEEKTLELQFKDSLVCEVLSRIDKYNIDTILTTWNKDTHRDHRVASEIALSASRRVPNFLMGQVNYYMTDFFSPNFYIDITSEYEKKIEALSLFRSQWERNKKDWTEFLDITSQYYGKIIGTSRAEGFVAKRLKY